MIDLYLITDDGGSNARIIESLQFLKESIERALRDAYPGRVDPEWLAQADELLRRSSELQAADMASATGLAEIDALLETADGVPAPAPLRPTSGPDGAGMNAAALPPAADPWNPLPPGMRSGGHQVGFRPGEAGHFDVTRPASTVAAGRPGTPAGGTDGWQAANTPGFGRLASSSREVPFSRGEQILTRLIAGEAPSDAEATLRASRLTDPVVPRELDASAPQLQSMDALLSELHRLADVAGSSPGSVVDTGTIDRSTLEILLALLDAPITFS